MNDSKKAQLAHRFENAIRTARACKSDLTKEKFLEMVLNYSAVEAVEKNDPPEEWPALELYITQKIDEFWSKSEIPKTEN